MNVAIKQTDQAMVLAKAVYRAGHGLGFNQDQTAQLIGRSRSVFIRGIDPNDKSGELALMLVRLYRSLFALVGGEEQQMIHWMRTRNRHLDGVPAERVQSIQGLVMVLEYLDAIRGKI